MHYFNTLFLEEATRFLYSLDPKAARKVFYNIDTAQQTNDPKLMKKVHKYIWEFRTKHHGSEIRLLAFWDKSDSENTLVIATNGFVKKTDKIPANEIERALRIRSRYFEEKN